MNCIWIFLALLVLSEARALLPQSAKTRVGKMLRRMEAFAARAERVMHLLNTVIALARTKSRLLLLTSVLLAMMDV